MAVLSPEATMARETRVRRGAVGDRIAGHLLEPGRHWLSGDEFLLRDVGLACHYRRGEGITVQLDDPAKGGALNLYLVGTVYSAIAAINGLLPLHASAVEAGGRAIAFTGAPGAGKSTIAAALRRNGHAIVADDTLVLDAVHAPPLCLPGHKRLKLWPDSLELTGMTGTDLVSEAYPKYFATSKGSDITAMLPLGAIVVLDVGEDPRLDPVRGAERITVLDDDHYTARLHAAATGHDPATRLAILARVANTVPVWRFTRPMDTARFKETTDYMSQAMTDLFDS